MNKVLWDSAAQPVDTTLPTVLYGMRLDDASEGKLLEPLMVADLDSALGDSTDVVLDGIVVTKIQLNRKMQQLFRIMAGVAPDELKPTGYVISEPKLRRMLGPSSTVNIDVIFQLDDGQTITIAFHNPDATPNKLLPTDELVSWKWLLNKRDVTIVVAPERGAELNVREVARRIMRIATKNHAMFVKANATRDERLTRISALEQQEAELDRQLSRISKDIEAEKINLEDAQERAKAPKIARLSADQAAAFSEAGAGARDLQVLADAGGYAAVLEDESKGLALQDMLDHALQARLIAVRNQLREMGWAGDTYGNLSKNGTTAQFVFRSIGHGRNLIGYNVNGIADTMMSSAAAYAASIDATAAAPAETIAEVAPAAAVLDEPAVPPPPVEEVVLPAEGVITVDAPAVEITVADPVESPPPPVADTRDAAAWSEGIHGFIETYLGMSREDAEGLARGQAATLAQQWDLGADVESAAKAVMAAAMPDGAPPVLIAAPPVGDVQATIDVDPVVSPPPDEGIQAAQDLAEALEPAAPATDAPPTELIVETPSEPVAETTTEAPPVEVKPEAVVAEPEPAATMSDAEVTPVQAELLTGQPATPELAEQIAPDAPPDVTAAAVVDEEPKVVAEPVATVVEPVPVDVPAADLAEEEIAPAAVIAEPAVTQAIDQRAADLAFLADVAEGRVDYQSDDIAELIEGAYLRHPDDPEVEAATDAAATAFQDFISASAQALLVAA